MAITVPVKGQTGWDLTLNNALNDLETEVSSKIQGPVTSTDKALVRFSGTSGSVVQNSAVTVDNPGNITTPGGITTSGTATVGGLSSLANASITGDLSVMGAAKGYRFRTGGANLDLEATGTDLIVSNWSGTNFNGSQRSYFRLSADAQNVQAAGKIEFADTLYGSVKHTLDGAANQVGFYGASPASKPTITGSRGGNAALASLITALATLGLITDNTTA